MPLASPRADVRTHLLQTALGLLAEHGVAWLTQTRVSRAAGVRQSHLTYYFPRRGDLLAGVAQHFLETVSTGWLARAQGGALTARDLPATLAAALTDRRGIRAMLGLIAAADEDPQVRAALRAIVARVRARFAALFSALGLPDDPASVALAHTFVVGAAVLHHARANAMARREAELAVGFIAGLLPRLPELQRASRPVAAGSRRRARAKARAQSVREAGT